MIIKGKSRSGPVALAAHLGNAEKNERVTLLETRGAAASDLRGALVEMDACAAGTRCEKPLYHAAISPAMPHKLSPEQRADAIDALEQKLGFVGHSRVVVMHEKLGREHIHVVWSRIDLEKMRAVADSHNYRKHEEVSRDLERRFGHERVQGAHHERDGVERPTRTASRAELRQEERTGIKGSEVRVQITELFRASDNAEAFRAALADKGYVLAKGDRRDYVAFDHAGGHHSLARRIEGLNATELRAFMSGLNSDDIPTFSEAKQIIGDRRRQEREADSEKSYSSGAGYVSQSSAALATHQDRQKALNKKVDREISDRIERLLGSEDASRENSDDWEPDRPREAPGGGRTRSR
jgi:hypothetical protein